MSVDELIHAIAGVSNGWQLAAFAIAAILIIVQFTKKSGNSRILYLAALTIFILGLVPIFADAYLKHAVQSAVYRVRILVLDPQGNPISGATLRTPTLNDTALTSSGVAELTIPRATLTSDGKITIYADLDAEALHASKEMQLASDLNPSTTITLKFSGNAVVSGLVEDETSRAISGATVSAVGGESGLTAMDGTFTLKTNAAIGQEVRLHVEKTGYRSVDQDHPAGRDPVVITLVRVKPIKKH